MRNNLTPLRPGLTAIAAVLALSATPAFAQDAQTAPAQDVPVIAAPSQAAPALAAEAAPAPVQSVTTENTAEPLATPAAAPMATQSTPVIHTTAESGTADSAPVARTRAPAKARPVIRATEAPAAPIAAPAVATPAPIAAVSAPAPVAAPEPAPVVKTSTSTTSTTASDDNRELEIAGAGALGLILLGGGVVAFSRRRNRDEEKTFVAPTVATVEPTMVPVAYETRDIAPVTVAPAIEDVPTTALHEDFDLSRYGPYVQAAYRGPTEDNPSLSLRHRLKRARFMDQRARENGEYVAAEAPIAAERKPVTQNLFGTKLKDGLRSLRPQPGMRPAFG